jgi:hypothetical protein
MKPVGGVEILGPASKPQKFQKEGSTQGCKERTDLDIQNNWLNFLDLCLQ